tara:strand:- start:357 stop:827 length:471 start_codon:yes stop_codon:yes gene_type:complete
MIINCPCGKKSFKVDDNLIPDNGRLLKCGSCNHTWFFNKYEQSTTDDNYLNLNPEAKILEKKPKSLKKKYDNIKKNTSSLPTNKGSELVKYKPKSTFSFGKFLSYLIVLIITFVALIIVLDTFKIPLSVFFPNLELILYNLFETLKDLILFTKDLK